MKKRGWVLVVIAVVLAVGWYWQISQYANPVAADAPVELIGGKAYSIPVSPSFSSNYAIELVFSRRMNTHVFACLTGGLNEEAVKEKNCGSLSPTLNLTWAVSAHGMPIAHGISQEPLSFLASRNKIVSTIAVFHLRRGDNYVLNARILSNAGPLSNLSPHIMIVATSDYMEEVGLLTDLTLLAVIVLLAGAVLSYIVSRRHASARTPAR